MSVSSTIDSSEAADYVKQQYLNLTKLYGSSSKALAENTPNIKVEDIDGIYVGNVIYNIHHHPQKNDLSESPRTSTTSFEFKVKKSFGLIGKCGRKKIIWILSIITAIILTGAAISVSVYVALFKDNIETTTVGSTDTTTFFDTLITTRQEWGAGEINSTKISKLIMPIKRIIIAHTRGEFCSNENQCILTVQSLQTQDQSLDDIPYNFLIGGDGRIYEGRGIEYQGQHTDNLDATEYNSIGICIAFIGNYESTAPNATQISLLTEFIDFCKNKGLIADDHIIVLQDDLKYFATKATALNAEIKKLDNFRPLYKIYRREEWDAHRRIDEPVKFNRTLSWVLIGHTADVLCTSLDDCKFLAKDIQEYSFTKSWQDILYNIFFGGDGFAFEGRGFDIFGSHHLGLNDKAIGVGVMGDFTSIPPNQAIIDAMFQVFDDAVALGKLTADYKIFGRDDFGGPGPGEAFMIIIKDWCRYGNRTKH